MHISGLMKIEDLEKAIADGLVSKRKHPSLPIYILNYTAATQFSWNWNDVTLNCRGLVIDEDYNIVARSFPKFFSYEQLDGKLPEGNYVVEEKMDGSMLLVFSYDCKIVTATRGSFESEQAIDAKRFIPSNFLLLSGVTYIFEYIAHTNRIVVDYKYEGLTLLDATFSYRPNLSLTDVNALDWSANEYGWKRPKVYTFDSLTEVLKHEEDNIEGFVLRYETGERVKIKTEDYKQKHKYLTGVSEKTIWENLKNGTFETWLEFCPDEMYAWITEVRDRILAEYNDIEYGYKLMYNFRPKSNDRKEFAEFATRGKNPAILFKMFDGKDYSELIWKMVKPEVTTVFKMVNEA